MQADTGKAAKITLPDGIDSILASVLQRRLKAITEEMGLTLLRTTHSPILNEARDFVTGLYDAEGRMLEQTEYIPVLAFALQPVCRIIIDAFAGDIHEGDVFLHNDVFSGGNQNNDVAVFRPIFFGGELAAWAACKGHQADIGGGVRGGYNPGAREVWQEAFRIPPVKVYAVGKRLDDVWNLIFANVRLSIVEDDINAQIGGTTVGERGLKAVLERYGRRCFDDHMEHLFAATERMVCAEITAIPDGIYEGESEAFYDGFHDGSRMKIKLAATVAGGRLSFDFAGTSPETEGFVNAPLAATSSAVLLTFLMLINPDIPHNDGLTRPVDIAVPAGSFLNAGYPAATTFGNTLTGPISDAIFRAFAPVLPGRVTAGWNRMLGVALSGTDPGKDDSDFVDILFLSLKGGSGAARDVDGYDHIGLINCAGGILAQDYEMFELQNPVQLRHHEYAPDTAGPGKWRGGYGVETEIVLGGEDMSAVVFGDGVEEEARAFGLYGGGAGALNTLSFTYPDGKIHAPKSKEIVGAIPTGTVLTQRAGGGGGYGDPLERSPSAVAEEVAGGLLSEARARADYGLDIRSDASAKPRGAPK
ncbi:MAG: hydantoinase B/oxoprolinase family protein [Rhodospirillales bacterium]|jgi:N-methylhydantoinase B|nr:hydantoin utilization protein B [Rhodospirillaceae bacterium]MDP6429834.1 hydantoinase B/oxoprolinase family protein [Rhodospirillales bacterium]MDP6646311.1 hydantoinase B/oxoprolinase family protein [Rhodospirillales bacterium]